MDGGALDKQSLCTLREEPLLTSSLRSASSTCLRFGRPVESFMWCSINAALNLGYRFLKWSDSSGAEWFWHSGMQLGWAGSQILDSFVLHYEALVRPVRRFLELVQENIFLFAVIWTLFRDEQTVDSGWLTYPTQMNTNQLKFEPNNSVLNSDPWTAFS